MGCGRERLLFGLDITPREGEKKKIENFAGCVEVIRAKGCVASMHARRKGEKEGERTRPHRRDERPVYERSVRWYMARLARSFAEILTDWSRPTTEHTASGTGVSDRMINILQFAAFFPSNFGLLIFLSREKFVGCCFSPFVLPLLRNLTPYIQLTTLPRRKRLSRTLTDGDQNGDELNGDDGTHHGRDCFYI